MEGYFLISSKNTDRYRDSCAFVENLFMMLLEWAEGSVFVFVFTSPAEVRSRLRGNYAWSL